MQEAPDDWEIRWMWECGDNKYEYARVKEGLEGGGEMERPRRDGDSNEADSGGYSEGGKAVTKLRRGDVVRDVNLDDVENAGW